MVFGNLFWSSFNQINPRDLKQGKDVELNHFDKETRLLSLKSYLV